jgi:Glycine-rich domain-containing protein-like/WWE domain
MNVFSSDLVVDTKKHVNFLQCLQKAGVLMTTNNMPTTASMATKNLAMMMDRYLNKWLPLVAALITAKEDDDDDNSSLMIMMIPPPDVAWLWYCHRLSPNYESYTKRSFGIVIEAYPAFSFQMKDPSMAPPFSSKAESDAAAAIKASWERVYSNDSFFLDTAATTLSTAASSSHSSNYHQDLSGHKALLANFDLASFCASQAKFVDHVVSQPCFVQDQYLYPTVDKYHEFLHLSAAVSTPLVPTTQIDLVWRTHILINLRQYQTDCIQIHGCSVVYHHHSSINDPSPGGQKLDDQAAFQTTSDLWQNTYMEPYDDDLWKPTHMPIVPLQTSTNVSSSSLSSRSTVIWEFQENSGKWTPYRTDQQNILESGYKKLVHATPAICKVQIQAGPWTYEVDVQTLKQTNMEHEDHTQRNIRRRNLLYGSFCWEYHDSNNKWQHYSTSDQTKIEDAYSSQRMRVNTVQLSSGDWTYNVDIQNMVQTNMDHAARTQRPVRRRIGSVNSGSIMAASWDFCDDETDC